jgi:5-(hydroxymethyl)furfural/furfural oxidase
VLGGASSINGQLANRGAPTDYEEWEARGAAGWSWKDVLPYFKKVEHDLDFDGPFYGKDGRIPVRRIPQEHWTRYSQAVAEACKLAGYTFLPDQNGEFVEGYFPVTHSNHASAAMGYLDGETRKRANLTISTETRVKELLFEGTRWSSAGARSSSRAARSIRRCICCAPASARSGTEGDGHSDRDGP